MLCPKCGFENAPGDAFCGSCGAFLEFATEEAAEAGAGAPGSAADSAAGAPPAEAGAPDPAAVAAAIVAVPAGTVPAPATAGPTCPACGRVNPAGRTFCISCGTRLPVAPAAGPTAGPPAGDAAASPPGEPPPAGAGRPAQPARPAWDFPTAPIAVPPPVPAAPTSRDGGGRSRLPFLVAAAAGVILLGGAALLVLGGGLGGGTPGGTPSPTPSDVAAATPLPETTPPPAATAAPEATPIETPAPEPPTPAPTPALTIPPGPPVGIRITSARASSQLRAERAPKYLYDGSPATTWKSASGKFAGAWVDVRFAPAAITSFQIWTGWQRSAPLYYGNHRPQNVTVSFDGGLPVPLLLQDIAPVDGKGAQRVDIPPELGIIRASRMRITIADVYPARKTSADGSPTKEVAISEIRLYGIPVAP
jgi:hypothetical protein